VLLEAPLEELPDSAWSLQLVGLEERLGVELAGADQLEAELALDEVSAPIWSLQLAGSWYFCLGEADLEGEEVALAGAAAGAAGASLQELEEDLGASQEAAAGLAGAASTPTWSLQLVGSWYFCLTDLLGLLVARAGALEALLALLEVLLDSTWSLQLVGLLDRFGAGAE